MSDHRCRTCKHWDTRQPEDGWGYCERAEMSSDVRDNKRRAVDHTSLAVAQDASNYHAALVTSPDFGCVQWEAKP